MSKTNFDDQLSDFSRDKRFLLLTVIASVIGALGSGIAWILLLLIHWITNIAFFGKFSAADISPGSNHLGPWVVVVPVTGAMIIGLMARYGSEKIRGHGIPEALEAILIGRSKMSAKVALLKPLSSAISIGTGGPFGAEGPIIMTGGAVGSLLAQLFNVSSAERKTLLVAGAAAGMSAVFCTPIAAVLLAVELLLFEWKPRSFIPVSIASIVAFAMRTLFLGQGPLFPVIPHTMPSIPMLVCSIAMGLIGGLAACALTAMVYGFEDAFQKLPIHWMWWPAIGGLIVGCGGIFEPRVLGVGYDIINDLLLGRLIGTAVLTLMVVKGIVWACALGSGTSGGVLAPLLIIGGALGAACAPLIPFGDAGLWAMVCMAATMSGTMRSPLTAMIFACELTHDYNVLPMLLLAATVAQGLTVLALRRSILTEKVARRGVHIVREYSIDPLQLIKVREIMDLNVSPVPADMKLSELSEHIAQGKAPFVKRHGMPVIDAAGKLIGIITRGDMVRQINEESVSAETVGEAASKQLVIVSPEDVVFNAVAKMLSHNIGRLPVVDEQSGNLIGYIGRADVLRGRLRALEEENVRESSWKNTRIS